MNISLGGKASSYLVERPLQRSRISAEKAGCAIEYSADHPICPIIEGGCHMPTFIVTGSYSATAAMGMIDNPSNREKAARAIFEAAGGKLHSFYVTTGETDWMAITEFDDGADLIPALLVVGASGAVSNVKTVRAYTGAEFKAAQEKAGKIASSYKSPVK